MVFISPEKLFSFWRYLSFCLDFLVIYQNGLIKKIMLISIFLTSQPGYQTIAMHILLNVLRSKDNQIMQFGQLIERNMRNIFLERSYSKCGGETSPRPFSKKLKLTISLDQWCKVLYSLLYYFASWGLSKYIETKLQTTCFHLILSFFKNKERSGTSLPASFSA